MLWSLPFSPARPEFIQNLSVVQLFMRYMGTRINIGALQEGLVGYLIILTWFWITMWSHNINFYTLPVLAQATCKSCYTDDLAQPGNPYNSHYWTRLETGRLLLLVLTRPGAQRKRSGGSSEDQQQQPDCRQPSPIMADVGTSHCSPKSCKVIVRKRLRYLDLF